MVWRGGQTCPITYGRMARRIAVPGGGDHAPMLAVIQQLKTVDAVRVRLATIALAAGVSAPHMRHVSELLHFLTNLHFKKTALPEQLVIQCGELVDIVSRRRYPVLD